MESQDIDVGSCLALDRRVAEILVVDDKLELADTLADGLVDRGYDARALGNGRDALAALETGGVSLVITDLRMPDVDGLALVDAARRSGDVPVIVMTAHGAIDSAVEVIRKGAFHYLTKPFKLDELVAVIERALRGRTQLRRRAVTTPHD